MADEELSKLFRVRRTVFQMLRDRHYLVDTADINRTRDEFAALFGDFPKRDDLTVLAQKRDDPTQGIFVFFPDEPKVGIKPIRRCARRSLVAL
ncbi:RNA polymerase [Pavlovales sp. CCMP2436]|nr:RNA polymerase [Pavlovales sp. CCMP2436]